MPFTKEQLRLRAAKLSLRMCEARLHGMKARAGHATPATGGFPYPARTCAEWTEIGGEIVERQMTPAERRKDAKLGSKMLKEAIERMAA